VRRAKRDLVKYDSFCGQQIIIYHLNPEKIASNEYRSTQKKAFKSLHYYVWFETLFWLDIVIVRVTHVLVSNHNTNQSDIMPHKVFITKKTSIACFKRLTLREEVNVIYSKPISFLGVESV